MTTARDPRTELPGAFRDGYNAARDTLADEPRPTREAAARALDEQRERVTVNSVRYQQITGALAYIVERRHES